MKLYEIQYEDPRWRDSEYVSSEDETRVRQRCEQLIQNYAADLTKDTQDIQWMKLELPLEFRWNGDAFQVTDAGNVAKSGKWLRVIAWACYEEIEVTNLDAITANT